jgi:hypothetical protein
VTIIRILKPKNSTLRNQEEEAGEMRVLKNMYGGIHKHRVNVPEEKEAGFDYNKN